MKLKEKTALITGASKRIGREIALALADRGATILIHYNQSRKDALKLQKEVMGRGADAAVFQMDFSQKYKPLGPEVKRFTRKVLKEHRKIDILINNAAIYYPTSFGKIRERDWDDFMTVNLKAPFFLSQEVGRHMLAKKSGKIINLVDWTIDRPRRDYLPYCISKAGLVSATKGLAQELAPHVQVNGIAPGPILPPEGMTRSQEKKILTTTPLKRFGSPADIAETVCFLCEGTDFVTGAIIPVEGGSLIK